MKDWNLKQHGLNMGYLKDFEKSGIPFHPYIKNDQAWKVSVPIL